MSNTSIGRGSKGSKFWIQTLTTLGVEYLNSAINLHVANASDITWLSPLRKSKYKELKTRDIDDFKNLNFSFWPDNGPWWDAVGKMDDGTILLVEAKGHTRETITKCSAKADKSINLIKQSLCDTHLLLAMNGHKYDDGLWYSKYYQLANRLTFLNKLSAQNVKVKLVLLNIVNDPTHIKVSEDEWIKHYEEVFEGLLGTSKIPKDVIVINLDVG
jgi:hypothetical protein